MTLADTFVYGLHLLFGALWVGAVAFVALVVVPLARDGGLNATPLGTLVARLRTISRTSALVLLLSGGHMAATAYTVDSLTGSGRGHLVLTMVALWFVLAALVEVAGGKLERGTDDKKVREPAREARPLLLAATAVGAALLFVAAALTTNLPAAL